MILKTLLQLLVFGGVVIADRLTKWYALCCLQEQVVNSFLSFELTFNRGISWGLFYYNPAHLYWTVTAVIVVTTVVLIAYTSHRIKKGFLCIGELLVMSGSLSNLFDRFMYDGVIDFIVVRVGNFIWPVFNIADICIVVGIGVLFVELISGRSLGEMHGV